MKLNKLLVSLLLGSMALGFAACSTEAPYMIDSSLTSQYMSAGDIQAKDDDALSKRLTDFLSTEFKGSDVKAIVRFDNVLLVGQVLNNSDKLKMVDICKKWPGTKEVYDYLTVVEPTTNKPNPSASLNMSSSLASKAMDLIKLHYDISPENIKLVVVDGVVYIIGTNVGNLNALHDAIENMYSIKGIHKVINLEKIGNMDYNVSAFK
ncbi:MAG: BON domain-containing protein [Neisseriaceae bacterium]|jgi:osmotically-inducible protein OsmY|nr:MAG: BON domain-containing protein [Neisseriaceae bacterium]